MLFITNRVPKQGIKTEIGRAFDFDLDMNAPSNSVFYCDRAEDGSITEIGSKGFMEQINQADYRQVLIYIHGFSNLPEHVFAGASEFQALANAQKAKEVLVIPIIWPCDNDFGIVKDYWDDQDAADESRYSLARVLQKFLAWRQDSELNPQAAPCLKRINVLAHSMGNRVFRGTLQQWAKSLPGGVPLIFRNSFLVAADVVNETLERDEPGTLITHASRNVVVYYASDDLALRASKAANLKNKIASRRLGHTGPENWRNTPDNVYGVDCDDVNTEYDTPKGHSYFRSSETGGQPGKVFQHIFDCLVTGRVSPDARKHIIT